MSPRVSDTSEPRRDWTSPFKQASSEPRTTARQPQTSQICVTCFWMSESGNSSLQEGHSAHRKLRESVIFDTGNASMGTSFTHCGFEQGIFSLLLLPTSRKSSSECGKLRPAHGQPRETFLPGCLTPAADAPILKSPPAC